MSAPHTPAGGAPPADAVTEHVAQVDEAANSGAGNEEPDPATAENPPNQVKAGDEQRGKEGAPDTAGRQPSMVRSGLSISGRPSHGHFA